MSPIGNKFRFDAILDTEEYWDMEFFEDDNDGDLLLSNTNLILLNNPTSDDGICQTYSTTPIGNNFKFDAILDTEEYWDMEFFEDDDGDLLLFNTNLILLNNPTSDEGICQIYSTAPIDFIPVMLDDLDCTFDSFT